MSSLKLFSPFLPIGLFAAILGAAIFYFDLFSGAERFFQDRLFLPEKPREDIVILAIDDAALALYGQWPWPRETFANIIEGLNTLKPAAIGIDVSFPEPSRLGEADDAALARAIQESKAPVILIREAAPLVLRGRGEMAYVEKSIDPLPLLFSAISKFQVSGQFAAGYANVIADSDGVVRSFPPYVQNQSGAIIPHFALALARMVSENTPIVHSAGPLRINYTGPPGTFHTASLALKRDPELLKAYREFTEGKIVIIGATAQSLQDQKPVPTGGGREMPGVEIHANILNMLLSEKPLLPIANGFVFAVILAMALLPAILVHLLRSMYADLILSLAVFIVFAFAAAWSFGEGTIIPVVPPFIAWIASLAGSLAYKTRSEEREKQRIRDTFSKYVSSEVLEIILENADSIRLSGQKVEATILFTDLEGFTKISESLPPEKVVELLNVYFETMSPVIKHCRGVIDKFIGDAIMAFWCDLFASGKHAERAVYSAFEMLKAIPKANTILTERGLPNIRMRIGISSGTIVMGNIGSMDRLNFTVIGDPVNAAARLEPLNKEYKSSIMVSEETMKLLTEDELKKYPLEKLGRISVRGKSEEFDIYGYREGII